MTRMPSVADSTVPAVVGSTKRLRTSICMIRPATASDMPASSKATVRGTRLTIRKRQARSASSPTPHSAASDSCPAPRLTLAAHSTTSSTNTAARPPQPLTFRRQFTGGPCSQHPCRLLSLRQRRGDLVHVLLHGSQSGAAQQIPVEAVQVHHALVLPSLGRAHQIVVQHALGRYAFAADRGVAINHEQPVRIGLGDEFERDGLAVIGHVQAHDGGLHAECIMDHAKARTRTVGTHLATRRQHDERGAGVGRLAVQRRNRRAQRVQLFLGLRLLAVDGRQRLGVARHAADQVLRVDRQVDGGGQLGHEPTFK
ncbi:hypothetical protein G6F65_017808 [Rhizopus arrhizus]|nr:hypothetical protein G6F65_017808 [Rhizopus arrhizus]